MKNKENYMIQDYYKYIESEIIKHTFVSADKINLTPLNNPAQTSKNTYCTYGITVFDPKKSFILKVDIPEGKKPWWNRLWCYIKGLFIKKCH